MAGIVDSLRRATGIDVESLGPTGLDRTVRRRMQATGTATVEEYFTLLSASSIEVQALVEEAVVPETWIRRDPEAFDALRDWVQAEWLPANPARTLRLLSLPCSTGEEPYSIAMTLLDAGLPAERFVIDAVDISARALEVAARGVFGPRAFRGRSDRIRVRYFSETTGGYEIDPGIRARVRFRQASLLEMHATSGPYEVVFCRNLLIYFGAAAQEEARRVLSRLVVPAGLLFVGPAEVYLVRGDTFESLQRPMAFGLRRVAAPSGPPAIRRARNPAVSQRRPSVPRQPAPRPTVRAAAAKPAKPAEPVGLGRAEQLANDGRMKEAADLCTEYLRDHGPSAEAYHLLGVLQEALGELDASAASFRRALYLEPDHVDALLHLALRLRQEGQETQAARLEARAQRVSRTAASGTKER